MPRFRIAVATAPFRLPLKDAITAAARIGAEGIQFDLAREIPTQDFGASAIRQLIHYVEERNLRVATPSASIDRPLYDLEGMDGRVASLRRTMELAAKMKLHHLAVRTGRIPDDEKSAEFSRLVEILRDLTQTGTHLGVTLCLTPSEDAAQTVQKLCTSIDTGLVAVDFDPAGAAMSRRDPLTMLRDLHAHVQHVQLRDGRCDVDGIGIEVPLGRGQVKWEELLALLDEMRYTNWCTVRRTQGDDLLGDSQHAIKAIRRLALGL